jgi:hypothetical protein
VTSWAGVGVDLGEVADTDQDDPLSIRAVGVLRACNFTVPVHTSSEYQAASDAGMICASTMVYEYATPRKTLQRA